MAKIVNSKSEIILDDPDEFPEGALLTYLNKKEIDYNLYNDPLKYLKDVWQGSDLCSMKLVDFAKEFIAIGNMNSDSVASAIYKNSETIHKHDTGVYWPVNDIMNTVNGITETGYFIMDSLKKLGMEFITEENCIYYRA